MVPKKSRELVRPTAIITGSDKDLVEDFVYFYWSKIREAMVNGKGHNIYVENIGTFIAKPDRIKELIEKYEQSLIRIEPVTFRKCEIIHDMKRKMEILKLILEQTEKDKIKKQEVKIKRYDKETE